MKSRGLNFVRTLLWCVSSTVASSLPVATAAPGAGADTVTVQVETQLGPFTLQLYPAKAPLTATNFLRYVDAGKYDGATFYRTVRLDNQAVSDVPIQVIQGGVYGAAIRAAADQPPETFPPIAHETTRQTGVTHVDGTISMARGTPGSATAEFFICIGDNPALDFGGARNPDGQGFAAFGRVTDGMEVVRQIHARASGKLATEAQAMRGQLLDEMVTIISMRRLDPVDRPVR